MAGFEFFGSRRYLRTSSVSEFWGSETPEEAAEIRVWLATPNTFVTGKVMVANGAICDISPRGGCGFL
jgi:hypothetical protein